MDGEIAPAALADLLETETPVRLIDVRREAAFRESHIPGSECLPLPELPQHVEQLDGAERIVTVCPHGEASVKAAQLIAAYEGIDAATPVESLAGGLAAWEGPLVEGEATSTDETAARDAPF